MDPLERFNNMIFYSPDEGVGASDAAPAQAASADTPQDNTEVSDQGSDESAGADASSKDDDMGLLSDVKPEDSAPEKYEPFKDIDGKEVDAAEQELFSSIAKEEGLSQADAVKSAAFTGKIIDKLAEQIETRQQEAETQRRAEFAEAWKASDADGQKTVQADEAFKRLPAEHQEALKESGMLHNNVIVSLLAENGRLSREGRSISGKPAASQQVMYANTPELYS